MITDHFEGIFPALLAIIKIFMNCLLRYLCTYSVTQSCPTPCGPLDCTLPGSSVLGILQAIILEWVAMPSSGEIFLTQGLNPRLLQLLNCRQILYPWATWEALRYMVTSLLAIFPSSSYPFPDKKETRLDIVWIPKMYTLHAFR